MLRRALHRPTVLIALCVLLYGALHARASAQAPHGAAPAAGGGAHIALLLPTGAGAFAQAANAVREGFEEGMRKQAGSTLPAVAYPVGDDPQQALETYRHALAAGARLVVGPLTRNGVTALARSTIVTVPTVALNVPDDGVPIPANLHTLSLQVETEARQIAELALRNGFRRAFTVTEPTPLGRRMREAFVEALERGGGYGIADYAYSTNASDLDRLRHATTLGVADMVFLALDASRARIVRPYLGTLAVYGTSHLNPGRASGAHAELADVRFVDMPWMVEPDHPAVMVYDRPQFGAGDLERLYALGIDAARIAQALITGSRDLTLDGVTGRLVLGPDRHFQRTLVPVTIDSGRLVTARETRP